MQGLRNNQFAQAPARAVALVATILIALGGTNSLRAQPSPGERAVVKAEGHYRQSDLLNAERFFLEAMPYTKGNDLRLCYDRLLLIYGRMARYDRAIRLGHRYEEWLGKVGDDHRRRSVWHQIGTGYFILGHYREAREYLEKALLDRPRLPELPPLVRIEAMSSLAQIAEKSGQHGEAETLWKKMETHTRQVLTAPPIPLSWEEQVSCHWKLSECYRFLNRPKEAIARLSTLLAEQGKRHDVAGQCETLRLIAGHKVMAKDLMERDLKGAEADLRRALGLAKTIAAPDGIRFGDLCQDLSKVLEQGHRGDEAKQYREEAATCYHAVVRNPREVRPGHYPAEAAFRKLLDMYQRSADYHKALGLMEEQFIRWPGESLAGSGLLAEQGILNIFNGSIKQAHAPLLKAVEEYRRQSPLNLVDLTRALNSLAIVEQDRNELELADSRAKLVLKLYDEFSLPDDLVLVETTSILGISEVLRGDYAKAVKRFQEGEALCLKIGAAADQQRSTLLLSLAVIHKSQGDLEKAEATCDQALELYQGFASTESLGYAYFLGARASLYAARGKFTEAGGSARELGVLLKKNRVTKGPLEITRIHCQALERLSKKDYAEAESLWRSARSIQETPGTPPIFGASTLGLMAPSPGYGPFLATSSALLPQRMKRGDSSLLPRTLNYLGLTAELQKQFGPAEELYAEALALQETGQAYPATYFVSLWRQAGMLDLRGKKAEARDLLDKAVAVVDGLRLRAYGDGQLRASYFAQFAPGFELLVDYSVREKQSAAAFDYSARSRGRNLLDQLQAAGLDPRAALAHRGGEPDLRLLREEEKLRQEITGIRGRALFLPQEVEMISQTRQLVVDLEKKQKRYEEVWRQILSANAVHKSLAADSIPGKLLESLRNNVVRQGNALLVYHVGPDKSYIMLLGKGSGAPEVFPLTVPASLVDELYQERAKNLEVMGGLEVASARIDNPRDLVLVSNTEVVTVTKSVPGKHGPKDVWYLKRDWAELLVDYHLRKIRGPALPSRGLELVPEKESVKASAGRLEQVAEALMPKRVRERLASLAPKQIIVVPDSVLHLVPLESLVLKAGPEPRYVLDELPPMIYAPSARVLAMLTNAKRPSALLGRQSALLTVFNPAYPRRDLLLPYSEKESKRISNLFDPEFVTELYWETSTEDAVRAEIAGKQVVHFAVHGWTDKSTRNLFGALVLTPPADKDAPPENDGFLSLNEIYTLPLKECELAVLSACVTNVGPQLPLEAGVTLAGAFLNAGARNVLASHWPVDDASTADLMGTFFEEAMTKGHGGKHVPYSLALQHARKKLRTSKEWSSPVYWAPFVLIGTGDAPTQEGPAAPPPKVAPRPAGEGAGGHPAPGRDEAAPPNEVGRALPAWAQPVVGILTLVALLALGAATLRFLRRRRSPLTNLAG
jgi:CHAT domain-containing protein/tetratricopeptide (TPR) repeat protein